MRSRDSDFLTRALALARRGCGHTRPNPPVGAVVVRDGEIVGEGFHRKAGADHAEVAALKDARRRLGAAADASLRESTLYVTLEPCSRPGRVGACTDAIAAAGIARVVYAVPDPNPVNRGRAARALARAGIRCERFRGDAATLDAARELVAPFAKRVTTGLPYVTVKLAMSLDGRICDDWGQARWISSARTRARTGALRAEVDAILVGAETVRRDDPSLLCHQRRNDDLLRAVVSKSGRLPRTAQVFADGRNPTLVFRDAADAIRELGRRGALHVLCEGGLKLATSLAEAGLVDEWMTVLSACVIGTRPIGEALRLRLVSASCSDAKAGDVLARFRAAPSSVPSAPRTAQPINQP